MSKSRSKRRASQRSGKKPQPLAAKPASDARSITQEDKGAVSDEAPKNRMHPRSIKLMWILMGIMLISFVLIAWLAPDPQQPRNNPRLATVLWRFLFLLVPLGVMYGLLWWDRILKLFKH
jgi:hypothetical protein